MALMKLKTRNTVIKTLVLIKSLSILLTVLNFSVNSFHFKPPIITKEYLYVLVFSQRQLERLLTVTLKTKRHINKLENLSYRNLKYSFVFISTLILLCGDIEMNPGPLTDAKNLLQGKADITLNPEPSTSTGVSRHNVQNRDERFMRPYFQWQGDDSSIDESQCIDNRNDLFSLREMNDKDFNVKSSSYISENSSNLNNFNALIEDKYDICIKCCKKFTKRAIKVHVKHCNKNSESGFNVNDTNLRNVNKNIKERLIINSSYSENSKKGISEKQNMECKDCGKMFSNLRGLRIHVAKTHHDLRRKEIANKYSTSTESVKNVSFDADNTSECQKEVSNLNNEISDSINEWIRRFSIESSETTFCSQVSEFIIFLADVIHKLPGPKHPARKYFEMRKRRKEVLQNRSYKMSSNPMRKTKNDRKRRKEKYEYEVIQYEYYNRRRKAVRKIMGDDSRGCNINVQELYNHFNQRFNFPNNKVLAEYRKKDNVDLDQINYEYNKKIDIDEVNWAVKLIKIDTSPGPDHILMRAIKIKQVTQILSLIFSNMHSKNIVPDCLKKARTILLDKGGNVNEISNWRPVSICSVIRRIYEKILDKRLKTYISLNRIQKGFINKPGSYINSNILSTVLTDAKLRKQDCCVLILDIEKAYDNVGHKHVLSVLDFLSLPNMLRGNIQSLLQGNKTQIETGLGKTKTIEIRRGVMQGAPLSPTLFNLSIDHILDEFSEPNIAEKYGYKVDKDLAAIDVLSFADDTVLISNSKENATILYDMISNHFKSIGLNINVSKTKIINICKGQLKSETFIFEGDTMNSISSNEKIKYLGVNFQNEILLDKEKIITSVSDKIERLAHTPYLKSMQKMFILNNYVWPTLTYPFQCAPLHKLNIGFLSDIDLLFRSGVKEIMELPNDFPSSILHASKQFKGLGLTKASWEAYLQHINICKCLKRENDVYLSKYRNFDDEIQDCLTKLKINLEELDIHNVDVKNLRKKLQEDEYIKWCSLPHKGKGAVLYQQCTDINKKINNLEGLTDSEFKEYLKLVGDVAPVRGVKGRSKDGTRCRHCPTNEHFFFESLPHVLGQCPFGSLLRNERHHRIRTIIADEFRKKKHLEVYEEVSSVADNGSTRRCDIIVLDKIKNSAIIIDPTIRFEINSSQPEDVNKEKKEIYNPTIEYYKSKYKIKNFQVIGLLIGSRGTIPKFLYQFWQQYKLRRKSLEKISIISIKSSVAILRNHLYNMNKM